MTLDIRTIFQRGLPAESALLFPIQGDDEAIDPMPMNIISPADHHITAGKPPRCDGPPLRSRRSLRNSVFEAALRPKSMRSKVAHPLRSQLYANYQYLTKAPAPGPSRTHADEALPKRTMCEFYSHGRARSNKQIEPMRLLHGFYSQEQLTTNLNCSHSSS